MKAIIVSESLLKMAAEQLVNNLGEAIRERESKIRTKDETGMVASPDHLINYYVMDMVDKITKG